MSDAMTDAIYSQELEDFTTIILCCLQERHGGKQKRLWYLETALRLAILAEERTIGKYRPRCVRLQDDIRALIEKEKP